MIVGRGSKVEISTCHRQRARPSVYRQPGTLLFRRCDWHLGQLGDVGHDNSASGSFAPILLCLTLHGRRLRILDLDPMSRATRSVGRAEPLRDDALAAERARFLENCRRRRLEVLVENQADDAGFAAAGPEPRLRCSIGTRRKSSPSSSSRSNAHRIALAWSRCRRISSKIGEAVVVADDGLAVDQA